MNNGKGSNTAKRTNFKNFETGYAGINWKDDEVIPDTPLPADIAEKLESITQQLEDYDTNLSEKSRNNVE